MKLFNKENRGASKNEVIKKLKYGSLSIVATVIGIIAIVLVNVLVEAVSVKFPISIDTSSQKYFELSDESIEYIKSIDDYELELNFIGTKQTLLNDKYYYLIVNLAEKYLTYMDNLKINYIDLDATPNFASKFDNAELVDGDAILSCGDRYRHLTSGDFIIDTAEQSSTGEEADPEYALNAEYALTTAMMVVTASDNPKAAFVNGHGEAEVENLSDLLVSNGFTVTNQSLMAEFDKDINILVVAAPTKDYSEDELKKLDDFLYNDGKRGKNIFYIADHSQPRLPNLEAFLADWGFKISEGAVYESEDAYTNPALNSLKFIDANITLSAALAKFNAYGYYGRPTKIADVLDVNMENSIVLQHMDTSKVGTVGAGGNFVKDDSEEAYPYVAMSYTSLETYSSDFSIVSSNVLFADSLGFFEGDEMLSLFNRNLTANADVTMAAVDHILGRENNLYIPAKNLTEATLSLSLQTADIIGAVATIGIPVVLLVICLVVYVRRRFL